ncbi:MAG: Unknown protein [uncultured Campylobacterales bacterium]|uniref:Integral membrane protein n=1 Tax=uncultured Campylobacterales bacterium TaxID=352960 RepID=A0A6S6SE41_9BACT|nr:MAG: Unknown protein [uncultured Campylobacterales bacterium]
MIKVLLYLVILLISLFIYYKISSVKNKGKRTLFIGISIAIIILASFGYEYVTTKSSVKLQKVATAFAQNKQIICNNKIIDNNKYTLNYGTFDLISKFEVINLKDCDEYTE